MANGDESIDMSEGEDQGAEDYTDSKVVKRLRTQSKKRLSDLVEQALELVGNRGSRGVVSILRQEIAKTFEQVRTLHDNYVRVTLEEGLQVQQPERYFQSVQATASQCYKDIDVYMQSRVGSAASSITSSPASRAVSSASRASQVSSASVRLRAVERQRAEAELRLAQSNQEREQFDAEEQILEQQRRDLERTARKVRQERERRELESEVERRRLAENMVRQEVDEVLRALSPAQRDGSQANQAASNLLNRSAVQPGPTSTVPTSNNPALQRAYREDQIPQQNPQSFSFVPSRNYPAIGGSSVEATNNDRAPNSCSSAHPSQPSGFSSRLPQVPSHAINSLVPVFTTSSESQSGQGPTDAGTVVSPDSWIYDGHTTQPSPVSSWVNARLPKLEIQPFNGDPKDWPMFIASFKTLIHDAAPCDAYRIALLRQSLAPHVAQSIAQTLHSPALYRQALAELKRKYGNQLMVSRSYIDALLELAPMRNEGFEAMRTFATELHGAIAPLIHTGNGQELNSTGMLIQTVAKLSDKLQSKWGKQVMRLMPTVAHPTLIHLDAWLDEMVTAEAMVRPTIFKQRAQPHALRQNKNPVTSKPPFRPNPNSSQPKVLSTVLTPNDQASENCSFCGKDHEHSRCPEILSLNPTDRALKVKEKACCFRCLSPWHFGKNCPVAIPCNIDGCKFLHHQLLHGAAKVFPKTPSGQKPVVSEPPTTGGHVGAMLSQKSPTSILLSVVPILARANGVCIQTYALLDSGSEVSLIQEGLADRLALKGPSFPLRLGTFHGNDPTFQSRQVNFELAAINEKTSFHVKSANTVPQLNLSKRSVNWPKEKMRWDHLVDLDIPAIDSSCVTMLIGMDVPDAHDQIKLRKPAIKGQGPRAILTPFGWCVTGPFSHPPAESVDRPGSGLRFVNSVLAMDDGDQLHKIVENFWKTDAIGVLATVTARSKDDTRALQILEKTTRHQGERYESGLLWRSENVSLPDNRCAALHRFFALERRLEKDPALAQRYTAVIEEYVSLGHAKKLQKSEMQGPVGKTWYLPHHGVVNPNKPEKVRVVFDASSRHAGISLNDALIKGPDLLTSLLGVFLRFRQHPIPLSADIEKMYHQVSVRKDDQSALRFLWRKPGSQTAPETYQMKVHVFGAVSSPTSCIYALQQVARDFGTEFKEVAKKVTENFYVDNYLDSVCSEKEAIEASQSVTELLRRGGFRLTKWISSSRPVLKAISAEELIDTNLNLDLDALPIERTLGIMWNSGKDALCFKISTSATCTTKREILSEVSSIFDPMGFLAPVVLSAKILLQDIWRGNFGWDESLPPQIITRWQAWAENLPLLERLDIPRCVRSSANPDDIQLHLFSDASTTGYGAVGYLRFRYTNGAVRVGFILAKSRVAPLRHLSIPRLELQGAVVAVRLANSILNELQLPISRVFFWTDSQTVLQWIHSKTCRFQAFVGNRVGEILESSNGHQWHHIPGVLNPADDCSRGLPSEALTSSHRWYTGPSFLLLPEHAWPVTSSIPEPDQNDPEISAANWTGAVAALEVNPLVKLVERKSNFTTLLRAAAYVLRFVERCRDPTTRHQTWLKASEFQMAEIVCIRAVQYHSFRDEINNLRTQRALPPNSQIATFTPFLDDKGVMRVGGRLEHSNVSFDIKHPILIPQHSALAIIIARDIHCRFYHAGIDRTLSEVRKRYWVPRGRVLIRGIIGRCLVCRKSKTNPENPLMAALPAERLEAFLPPFTNVGIDYFGPFTVTIYRRQEKRYGCLFTCLVTRAVHIEISHSLDTDSFLLAFRRFISRRGVPASCFSDNGTNLTAGEREMREAVENWNRNIIGDYMAQKKIDWHFSPPAAPHFGGVWERVVRSAKTALRHVLAKQTLREETLHTLMTEVEHLLNGRPLTHVSVNPHEPEALTPNHFLLGRANPNIPPDVINPEEITSRRRWRAVQALTDHFWRRWMKEYMPNLIERRKWMSPKRNLQEGDIVIIVDNNTPRGHWPLGRIVKPLPGSDGTVRAAVVRTGHGELTRPVAKLCLLEEAN